MAVQRNRGRRKSNMTKAVWEKTEEGAKMLVEYVKNIGLHTTDFRHQEPNRNEERKNKKRRRKPQIDKEKDNEDRQRKLELRNK
jgi:hypothetical protein